MLISSCYFDTNDKDPEIVLKPNQLKAKTVCTAHTCIIVVVFKLDIHCRCLSLLKKELMVQYQQKLTFATCYLEEGICSH